jgi:thiol:disulfide interchange protein DsbC
MTGPSRKGLRASILVPVLAACLFLRVAADAGVNPPYVDVSQIPLSDALLVGDPAAIHRLIVFSDPDCPFCAKYHEEIRKVVSRDPRIAFHVKVFPNNNSAVTYRKAVSIVCGRSVKLLEDSFAGREVPPPACRTSAVEDTMRLVHRWNIAGTPTTVLPDGRVVYGFQEADTLLRLVAERKR